MRFENQHVAHAPRLERAYYAAAIATFLGHGDDEVLGQLTARSEYSVELTQRDAWQQEVRTLRAALQAFAGRGHLYLELGEAIDELLGVATRERIDPVVWDHGRYRPTPTIAEAASALYRGHSVVDISKHGADESDLSKTSATVSRIIEMSDCMGSRPSVW